MIVASCLLLAVVVTAIGLRMFIYGLKTGAAFTAKLYSEVSMLLIVLSDTVSPNTHNGSVSFVFGLALVEAEGFEPSSLPALVHKFW